MAQLIQLNEAASLLGMKPEELVELRSRGEIHGYRDGSTWKFKESELERYAGMQGITLGSAPVVEAAEDVVEMAAPKPGSGLAVDDDLDEIVEMGEIDNLSLEDSGEELLLEDDVTEIAKSGEPTAESTMIGKKELGEEMEILKQEDGGSGIDLELDAGGSSFGSISSFGLDSSPDNAKANEEADGTTAKDAASDDSLVLSSSDSEVDVAPSSGGSELDLDIDGGSSLKLSMGSEIEPGKESAASGASSLSGLDGDDLDLDLGSALNLSDDEMELSVDSSDELDLDSGDMGLVTDSALGLHDPADSDVTLDPSGSGINLSPSDSGLSLEQTPPELAMTGADELELGEAEELVDFGDADIELDDGEGLETDDFVLTPVEGDLGDEDSGSQVIALDTDDLSDDAGMLGDSEEEIGDAGLGSVDDSPSIPGPIAPVGADTPYTIWNVVGFGLILLPLTLTGVMVLDLAFHIWSFDQPYSINSQLMDLILGMFGS